MDDGDVQIDPEHVTGHGAKEHQKSDKDPHTKKAMALHIDRPEKKYGCHLTDFQLHSRAEKLFKRFSAFFLSALLIFPRHH